MATEVSVPLSFFAKFEDAANSLNKFVDTAEDKLGGIQGNLNVLKTIAGGVVGAFAFDKIAEGFVDVVKEAAEAQQGIFNLANAMKSAGDFSKQNLQAFKDLADQIARNSVYDNDLVLSQFTLAKQFGATNKEASTLVQAATELAARTGIDLPTATNFLGRSLDGTAGRLNELIPQMRRLTAAELENNGAAKLIIELYGGTAAAATLTFGGAVSQAHNAYEDFRKSIGASVVDNQAAIQGVQLFTKFMRDFTAVVEENKDGLFNLVTNGVILLADGFVVFLKVGQEIQQFFEELLHYATSLALELSIIPERLANIATLNFAANDVLVKAVRQTEEEDKQAAISRLQVYEKLADAVAGFSVGLEKAKENNKSLAESANDVAKGFDNQTTSFQRFSAELAQKAKAIIEEVKNTGANEMETLTKKYVNNVTTLYQALTKGVINEKDYATTVFELKKNYEEKLHELKLKHQQEELAQAKAVFDNPIGLFTGQFDDQKLSKGQQQLSAGFGIASDALNGQQGAIKLVGQAAAAVGTALLGPAGQALGPITEMLAQGPDKVHQMVDQFLKALPQITKNIILAIPEIIETFVDDVPDIIDAFIDAIPEIVDKLIERLPDIIVKLDTLLPRVVERMIQKAPEFVTRMIADVPKFIAALVSGAGQFIEKMLGGADGFVGRIIDGAGEFVQKLLDSISGGAASGLFGGGGGGIGGFLGGAVGFLTGGLFGGGGGGGGLFGFAEGGTVPDGYPNDRLVARLSSGENVIDRSTNEKLNQFLDTGGGGAQTLHLNLKIGETQLSKVIVNLNKRGFRTA